MRTFRSRPDFANAVSIGLRICPHDRFVRRHARSRGIPRRHRLGLSGTTTCSPRPPVVFTQDLSFSVVRTSRTNSAALTTCCHETSGPGSRSQTIRFGRSISSPVEFQCGFRRSPSAREIRPPRSSLRRDTRQSSSFPGCGPCAAHRAPRFGVFQESCTAPQSPGNAPALTVGRRRAERSSRRCAQNIESELNLRYSRSG